MRKSLIEKETEEAAQSEHAWLDLEALARVEMTSEDAAHPIEAALTAGGGSWRAAVAGEQTVRLLFDTPQLVRMIRLVFDVDQPRTQEFVLRWSGDTGITYHDIARQQWNFSSPDSIREQEDYVVQLDGVTALELSIIPNISGGDARASLAEWRVA